jgi:hypothetical protein
VQDGCLIKLGASLSSLHSTPLHSTVIMILAWSWRVLLIWLAGQHLCVLCTVQIVCLLVVACSSAMLLSVCISDPPPLLVLFAGPGQVRQSCSLVRSVIPVRLIPCLVLGRGRLQPIGHWSLPLPIARLLLADKALFEFIFVSSVRGHGALLVVRVRAK